MKRKYEVASSEYCEDAPDTITLDHEQFRSQSEAVSKALQSVGFNKATQWFAGADYEALDEEGKPCEIPWRYEMELIIYSDGDVKLEWYHKHDDTWKFWVSISMRETK